jgi:hypothetical protein
VSSDPEHFYLKDPTRNPQATYKILYFRHELSNSWTDTSKCYSSVKVDILLPGIMHLPALPENRIVQQDGLPVVPFSLLLLQKLQAWSDRKDSENKYHRSKAQVDIRDLGTLFLRKHELEALEWLKPWSDRDLFSEQFEASSRARVKEFCVALPKRADSWKRLGFATCTHFKIVE